MRVWHQFYWKIGLSLLLSLSLTGCWSAVELNNRVFVSTLIIDQADEGIELTIGFPLTNQLIPGQTGGVGGSSQPSAFISRTGGTLEEALQKIQGDLSRKLTFGQTQSIIIGTKYARHGIEHILEFIVRHPYLHLNSNLFLVDGNAKEKVARSPVLIERFLMSVLSGYVRNNQVLSTTVKDMMNIKENAGDRILPVLNFKYNYTISTKKQYPTVGTGGAGVFRQGKLIGPLLTPEETSSARSLLAQLKQYIYSVSSPTDGKKIGVYTNSMKTVLTPELNGENITMHIHCFIEAGIIASESSLDMKKMESLTLIEEVIEQIAQSTMEALIVKTQRVGADVFNYGQRIEVKYPRKWNEIRGQWREYYKHNLKVKVSVHVSLKRTGSSSQAFNKQFLNSNTSSGR
ncbi:Ger(x)C family spore germination protein [Paenibacillus sp. HB172176]|uniref:Ger(x)C family spore germination protein n=1 Tax=Paenibacillus sp. HB172176 TaxID=2493690 RepID=UPI0014389336|nr:Ger(x)C family spore germination protein [Paenibacillus sp. HB172176]